METTETGTVAIGGARIAAGRRAFIIAEAGVNHDGRLATALALVQAARQAGADAVKFQIFTADQLAVREAPTADYQRTAGGAASQRELLKRLELSDTDFRAIAEHCRQRGLCFLATPFSLPDLMRLRELDAPAVKIASTDLNNSPLLEAAAATGLPAILSTGASTLAEVDAAVAVVDGAGARKRLVLLHCVSAYPTRWDTANLRAIGTLQRRYGVPVGFSDHTTSTQTGALATAAGAAVLEKHLTLDRAAPGPDHAMSLDPCGFGDYVAAVRRAEAALGDGTVGLTDAELEVRRVARKSVVAARRIRAGEVLTPAMLALKRPDGGIPPGEMQGLMGRVAAATIEPDTLIRWEMVR